MIDAGPSLMLAERLGRDELLAYLSNTGWSQRASRMAGFGIWSKTIEHERQAEFVLPSQSGTAEETRRIADALRIVAAVEGRDIETLAEDVRRFDDGSLVEDQDAIELSIAEAIVEIADTLGKDVEPKAVTEIGRLGSTAERSASATVQRKIAFPENEVADESQRTISRSDLVKTIYKKMGLSRAESAELVEFVIDEICASVVRGERVKLSSFGSFVARADRIGQNPKTGEIVSISPQRVTVFKPSAALIQKISESLRRRRSQTTEIG